MKQDYIKEHIIAPALMALGRYSDDRADMVLTTGAAESLYTHVRQVGGRALGLFQMEHKTPDDLWVTFLSNPSKQHLLDGLLKLTHRPSIYQELEINHAYAAAMCAVKYMTDPDPLPETGDRMAQAEYWKRIYNTRAGKGTVGGFMEKVTAVLR